VRGIYAALVDHAGRLWCGAQQGLLRVNEPGADNPRLVRYSPQRALSDGVITSLSEDRSGRLYVGTRRGVERLDAGTGAIRRYTPADGLAAFETNVAYRDRHGALWYGTAGGLSRLLPGPDRPQVVPRAVIGSVRIDRDAHPLSDLGETVVGPLRAPSPRSGIEIGFFALSFAPGRPVSYQYRMDGIDGWSLPTEQSTVLYPRLAPGTYRFLVRVANGERGAADTTPASVTVVIPRPFWATWWFMSAVAGAVVLAAYTLYRHRLARLLEIERIRTRLAMDLHDDIGSALSQVAVMSAVAKQRAEGDHRLADLLERIAERSRQLIDTMSDVVWAINPERDSLRDLAQRMRRFAAETLEAQDIQLQFELPGGNADLRLDAAVRREVFLIFKEAINNLVRYANCTRTVVGLRVEGPSLVLNIQDDGVGFDPDAETDGLGLRSMRDRASRLGASLAVRSRSMGGTSIRLAVPVRGLRRRAVTQLPRPTPTNH
jgi:signal transduction histidine kinase